MKAQQPLINLKRRNDRCVIKQNIAPILDLINIVVGQGASKGERDEMQDAHLCISDFKDYIKGGYSGEAYAI